MEATAAVLALNFAWFVATAANLPGVRHVDSFALRQPLETLERR